MAVRPTPRKWTDIQLVIATIAMTTVLALWNIFAGPDREKAAEKAALQQAKPILNPTELPTVSPAATMPPPGYTILFGGEAPKPQIIVQQPRGGGGGGGAGGGGAVTSTGSS